MRLHISADIEGVAGVTSEDHLWPGQFEFEAARQWMTNEVLAAIQGAESAGVKEFVVDDSHGNGENILLDQLPDNVELIRSWPRPLMMMQGLEEGDFIGTLLIGYHASATWPEGVQAHTLSGVYYEVRANGIAIGEGVLSAAIAGHFNVPVLAVSGDNGFINEARTFLPEEVEYIETKFAYGYSSVKTPTSRVVCQRIESGVKSAIKRRNTISPFNITYPAQIEIDFVSRKRAEVASGLPGFTRKGSQTICFEAKDAPEMMLMVGFFLEYGT